MGVANVQGEDQKKLDIVANDLFINMLKSSYEVCVCVHVCVCVIFCHCILYLPTIYLCKIQRETLLCACVQ